MWSSLDKRFRRHNREIIPMKGYVMTVVQILRPAKVANSTDKQPIDWVTKSGMYLLVIGILVSMAMLVLPNITERYASLLVQDVLHIQTGGISQAELAACAALGVKAVPLGSAGLIAQVLWLVGACLLCVQPYRTKSYSFLVFEVSMVLASLLPLLDISFGSTVVLRTVFTVLTMLCLGMLPGESISICKAMLPWNWGKVWKLQMGETALAVLGSEILCWGYALFGVNTALAWVALVAGSVVMMRFGWAAANSGVKIAIAWYYLNMAYVIAGGIQLLWLLKSV